MSTTTVSNFDNLNPFKGATAHTWLIFLKDFTQCLNNTGLASQSSNLHFATGLLNDMNEVKIIDMGLIDGSMNVRVVMRFTGDVKYGFAEDVVTYGIVNSAN